MTAAMQVQTSPTGKEVEDARVPSAQHAEEALADHE